MGASSTETVLLHLLPNCLTPVMAQFPLSLSYAILDAAALSFIGLGVPPPTPEWGNMVRDGVRYLTTGEWWMAIFPGGIMALTILAFNLLGDGLRDVFDPRTQMNLPRQTPLLEVRDLAIEFRSARGIARAVTDATFTVRHSEIVGLVGESGSGKSVTGNAILGLVAPGGAITAGSIHFDGHDLVGDGAGIENVRGAQIATIVQNPLTALNPLMRVGKQIDRVYRRHAGASAAAAAERRLELLRSVRIADPESVSQRYPHQLSGGMAQRVMIVMALICQPQLVIADEPTTGLDVTVQRQILELLRQCQQALGMSVLFITHDLGVVAQSCERVVVMYAGRVVEQALTEHLFATPRHPYSLGLIQSATLRLRRCQHDDWKRSQCTRPRVGVCVPSRCPHATDVCRTEVPALVGDDASRVACHHPLAPAPVHLAGEPATTPSRSAACPPAGEIGAGA